MRLLVLDECLLLAWMVEQLSPPGTEVLGVASLDEARRVVLEKRPDAAVVSITPARLPWRDFQQLCASREPPVPVLYQSCLFSTSQEAGLEPVPGCALFLQKPAARADFHAALDRLLKAASELRHPLN